MALAAMLESATTAMVVPCAPRRAGAPATALPVQYDAVWQIVVVFACVAAVGVLAERVFGHGWWLLLCLVGFGLGALLLWLDRRRAADAPADAGPGPHRLG
jgi:hypothetical protein